VDWLLLWQLLQQPKLVVGDIIVAAVFDEEDASQGTRDVIAVCPMVRV
jgi:hypothetical protein